MIWGGMSAQDIVVLLTGIGAFIVTVGGFFAKLIMDMRQLKTSQVALHTQQTEMQKTVENTATKIDGLTEKAIATVAKAAKAEGKLEGKAEGERAAEAAIDLAKVAITKNNGQPEQN